LYPRQGVDCAKSQEPSMHRMARKPRPTDGSNNEVLSVMRQLDHQVQASLMRDGKDCTELIRVLRGSSGFHSYPRLASPACGEEHQTDGHCKVIEATTVVHKELSQNGNYGLTDRRSLNPRRPQTPTTSHFNTISSLTAAHDPAPSLHRIRQEGGCDPGRFAPLPLGGSVSTDPNTQLRDQRTVNPTACCPKGPPAPGKPRDNLDP